MFQNYIFVYVNAKIQEYKKILSPFLPDGTSDYVSQLIFFNKTSFKIAKKRRTKLGDYRIPINGKGHRISVNGDLNNYAFLVTTIHEFAHLLAFQNHGNFIKPHGQEWQNEFKLLFKPILDQEILPTDVSLAIKNYLKRAKASSCSDEPLYRVLKRYDKGDAILVEHLTLGEKFKLNNYVFEKGKKLRKYYLCKNIENNRHYRVLGVAEVQKYLIDE